MASVNKVILLGTLGRDPEIRYTNSQLPIASLSLATTSYRRSSDTQERIEETEWHRVSLFGRQAEIAQQYLKKGSRAYIEGRLRTRKYDKDGQTHYATEIVADQLQLIDRRPDGAAPAPQNGGFGAPARSVRQAPRTQEVPAPDFMDEEPPF